MQSDGQSAEAQSKRDAAFASIVSEFGGGMLQLAGVVLLSPACASFDSFENFERRGDRFREIVGAL